MELDQEALKKQQHELFSLDITKQSHNNSVVQDQTLGVNESRIEGGIS